MLGILFTRHVISGVDLFLYPMTPFPPNRPITYAHYCANNLNTQSDSAMPPNRNSRSSDVPDNFIINWRTSEPAPSGGSGRSGSRSRRPLVRRPITACESCRVAKVRCNGQQKCRRCVAKGLSCIYTSSSIVGSRLPPDDEAVDTPSRDIVAQSASVLEDDSQGIDSDTYAPSSSNYAAQAQEGFLQPLTTADWPTRSSDGGISPLDWDPIDPALTVRLFDIYTLYQ